jgi:hypothetical protein
MSVAESTVKSAPLVISKAPASEIVEPLRVISSTVRVVSVPRLVMLDCAAPVTVAAVPEVFPVRLPVTLATRLPTA